MATTITTPASYERGTKLFLLKHSTGLYRLPVTVVDKQTHRVFGIDFETFDVRAADGRLFREVGGKELSIL